MDDKKNELSNVFLTTTFHRSFIKIDKALVEKVPLSAGEYTCALPPVVRADVNVVNQTIGLEQTV